MTLKLAITGMGAVTPVGIGVETYWRNLLAGQSGIGPISHFDASRLPTRIAAEVRDFQISPLMPKAIARSASPFMQYAFTAGAEALEQARLLPVANPEELGICMATAFAGVTEISERAREYMQSNTGKISPHFVPRAIGNMGAALLAIAFGAHGPSLTIGTACSAGNDALIAAAMLILSGECDAVLTVGAESILCPPVISSLAQAKALSRRNDEPAKASRPFDLDRDGFVVGEGAGAVVLEREDRARERGAKCLAYLAGWGNTMDAWHVTAPDPSGRWAAQCMSLALKKAGMDACEIDYINAHGTATPLGDVAETRAVKEVFGANPPPISSTKGATGHLMGAGGLTEAIACIMAMEEGIMPYTLNLDNPDPACDLDHIANEPRKGAIKSAMSNSMGFGGQNSTLIFTKSDNLEFD